MTPEPQNPAAPPDGVLLPGPVTYRGLDAEAHEFLDAVQARVASIAVKVRWLGGSAVWVDVSGEEVARVTADRPILISLIATWARTASLRREVGIDIDDR